MGEVLRRLLMYSRRVARFVVVGCGGNLCYDRLKRSEVACDHCPLPRAVSSPLRMRLVTSIRQVRSTYMSRDWSSESEVT